MTHKKKENSPQYDSKIFINYKLNAYCSVCNMEFAKPKSRCPICNQELRQHSKYGKREN